MTRGTIKPVRINLFALLIILLTSSVIAHEGHKPLPAKGVEIDVKRGAVLLTQSARNALGVQTEEVTLESGEDRVLAYAKLVSPWQQRAFVGSQIPGRITQLHVRPGDTVSAGQLLADIESPDLQKLQLDFVNARNAFVLSKKLIEHFESNSNVVVGSKIQDAESNHRENRNALEIARLKLSNLGFSDTAIDKLSDGLEPSQAATLHIYSPIAGTAYHSDLSIGKVVSPQEHLFEVVDLTSVWGKIEILERDLQRIEVGHPVEVTLSAYPDEIFRGDVKVKEISLDATTHLGTVWIDLENPADKPPRLLPGMFGQAQVIIAAPDQLLTAPVAAVARDGAERFVLVQEESTDKASQYVKRNVVVVRQTATSIQFRADKVFPGDRIVTTGAHELFNFFVQGVLRLSKEATENIGLRTEFVQLRMIGDGIAIDGLVELLASGRDSISPQLPGTIERLLVSRGQRVRAGVVICEMASLEFQDLQLQLVTAENEVSNLEATIQRWEPLRGSSTISQRQRWETESSLRSKQNLRDSLRRRLQTIGLTNEQLDALITAKKFTRLFPLRTTIDGFVAHFDKVLGQSVAAGELVVEVQDPSQALVRGFVSEAEMTHTRIDQPARVRFVAIPDFIGEATIVRSGRGIDSLNRTLSIWLELPKDNTENVLHNMLVRINLVSDESPPVLAISRESVISEPGGEYVFVQAADGQFERRLIKTGRNDDRFVELISGLQAGEKIAAWGVSDLQSAYAALR